MGVELAKENIRVNAVAPGWIVVPSHFTKYEGYNVEDAKWSVPRGRVGQPLDVAKACVFLASEDADFVVGTTLLVDGGTIGWMSMAAAGKVGD